jgi:preprotein translocase subunit SecG
MGTLVQILLAFFGVLLIFIILLQRGRGGGLAGALGGAGGQSAFGTKAGDVFTRVTIGVVVVWVLLACIAIKVSAPVELYPGGADATDPPAGLSSAGEDDATTDADESDSADSEEENLEDVGDSTKPAEGAGDADEKPAEPAGDE